MPTIIITIPLLLLIVIVGLGVYFFIYRRHINKVLRENYDENVPVHRLPAIPSVVFVLWAAAVLICTWVSVNQLSILYSKIEELSEQNKFMYDSIISLGERIKEDISESNQLVTYAGISFGDFDTEGSNAEITFTVTPKLSYVNAEFTITIEDKALRLTEQSPGIYTGSIMLDVLAQYEGFPLLTIEHEGRQQTEYLRDINLNEVRTHYFPHPTESCIWNESSDGEYTFIEVYMDYLSEEVLDSFLSMDMTVKVNDVVDIEIDLLQNENIFDIDGELELFEEKILTGDELLLEVEGAYLNGYVFNYTNSFIYNYEMETYRSYSSFQIFDKEGNTIYSVN